MKKSAKDLGLTVQDVFLISAVKGQGMDTIRREMEAYRKGEDVYVVGSTNVGKSTFINRLIHESVGIGDAITTSYFPGTTLGFIDIPLDDDSSLFDTPGVINRKQMAHYVSEQDLKVITPKKEIKPRIFQLEADQTLYFGGLVRLDFEKGEKQSFVCYFSNQLHIHRTKRSNADELYDKHVGELLSPPNNETLQTIPPFTSSNFKISEPKTDIVFPGLGWVTVTNGTALVKAYSPKGVSVSVRDSFI